MQHDDVAKVNRFVRDIFGAGEREDVIEPWLWETTERYPRFLRDAIRNVAGARAGLDWRTVIAEPDHPRLKEEEQTVFRELANVPGGKPTTEMTRSDLVIFLRRLCGAIGPPVRLHEWPGDVIEKVLREEGG